MTGLGLGLSGLIAGCFAPADDCKNTLTCPAGAASSTGGGGGNPPTDPSCIPSQAEGPVGEKCGVFVTSSTGNDGATGSKGTPVATMAKAIELALAGDKRVYACAETFHETVVVPAGIEIYGGLDCKTGWSYAEAARTTVTSSADVVPLKLSSGVEGTTKLENVSVTAADAATAGGSSIAAIIDNVTAELTRCDFVAGRGAAGKDGEIPMTDPDVGPPGMPGSNTCDMPPVGGAGGTITCGGAMSVGGDGGNGGVMAIDTGNGQGGLNGQPMDAIAGAGGPGAAGVVGCGVGGNGRDGDAGMNGLGGTGLGSISIAGFAGVNGQDGGMGTPGQGGGGGGGYKSGVFCGNPAMDGPGASGGGGGAGGCGGQGGVGGQAGGSSIALISLNATLKLTTVTVTAGEGGKGGAGSSGQAGGQGGSGGLGGKPSNVAGSKAACKGGDGGYGGPGGSSGGGVGGHSIGIAYQGMTAPTADGVTPKVGAPGAGGLGANGDPTGDGAAGMASMDPVAFP